ncbi:hypothetical protein CARUB_v10003336mg [Capsella rubella]|uniref:Knottin scorpion toxin-like domain-containing protein n=1 Tax=Capsella rubella TaxID=81985 RepID=R0H7X3_9BRAS|nr:putative defensin-like protein 23 [Capsella rubella]EOA19673.1 hypothetical protein CARUB_v10003336mg [Capsella rubella]
MTTTMKIMSFAMLLVLLFSLDVVVEGSDSSLCCNTHPKFGACKTYQDRKRCNNWCRDGCSNKKGGFCKRVGRLQQCHCYC